MTDITIRPATEKDTETIKTMVNRERLNPLSLDWTHFLIAEIDGNIAGIGQIKPHKDCEELASLVTNPDYRGRGVASKMIAELEQRAERPLYLRCADKMQPYYKKFGYQVVTWREAPQSLKLFGVLMRLLSIFGIRGLIMRKD
ncbi:MAG: GNAT family N-acetyltransferase [Chloroflexota bacterium]